MKIKHGVVTVAVASLYLLTIFSSTHAIVDPKWSNLEKHLFIDSELVDPAKSSPPASYGIKVNAPYEYDEILKPDTSAPWEANGYHYFSNVLEYNRSFNGTLYKYIIYYRRLEAGDNPNTTVTESDEGGVYCVALSNDGLSWTRPIFSGSSKYNGQNTNCVNIKGTVSFVLDDPNGATSQKYKMLRPDMWYEEDGTGHGGFGVVGVSADGLQFTPLQKRLGPVNTYLTGTPAYDLDTQNTPFWDDAYGKYRFYVRGWNGVYTNNRWKENRRSVHYGEIVGDKLMTSDSFLLESSDNSRPYFKNGNLKITTELPSIMETSATEMCKWIRGYTDCSANPLVSTEDKGSVDIYHTAAFKYPFASNTYLSFPTLYYHYTNSKNPGKKLSFNDGEFEPQFAASRNGTSWTRYKRVDGFAPYFDRGTYPTSAGNVNMRMLSMGQGMISKGNDIYQFFIALPRTHGGGFWWQGTYKDIATDMCGTQSCRKVWYAGYKGGVFVAKQRKDGFASLATVNNTSVVTVVTDPLTITKNKLVLNGKTGSGGYIKVAILNEAGAEVAPYSLSNSTQIGQNQDFLEKQATWSGRETLDPTVSNSPIRLKFEMKNAQLFALTLVDTGGPTSTPTRAPSVTATMTPTLSPTPITSGGPYIVDTQQFFSQSLGTNRLLAGYWVIVRNMGTSSLQGLVIDDWVSAGVQVLSVSQPEGVVVTGVSAERVQITVSDLPPDTTRTIMLFTLVPKGDPACPGSNTVEYPAPDGSGPVRITATGESAGCVIQ